MDAVMYSVIGPDQHVALWAVLASLTAAGLWFERQRLGRHVPGVALVTAMAFGLSNLGVIPRTATAYDIAWSYLVPLAIPLLLFKADLRTIIRESGPMLLGFTAGAIGTVLGALVGFAILPLGPDAAALTGVFTATYIGGSMNFAAVASSLEFDNGELLSAAIAADSVAGTGYLLLLAVLPSLAIVRRLFVPSPESATTETLEPVEPEPVVALEMAPLTAALAVSFTIFAVSEWLMGLAGQPQLTILMLTALTVLLATLMPRAMSRLHGDYALGMIMMYFFFASIGASADVGLLWDKAPVLLLFAAIILATHFVVITVAGLLFRLNIAEVIIASNACALGPATAAALAGARGYRSLVTPAVLCGTLGYAVASFIGLGLAGLL